MFRVVPARVLILQQSIISIQAAVGYIRVDETETTNAGMLSVAWHRSQQVANEFLDVALIRLNNRISRD